jgi:DNA-binding response OmpR family regulator
MPQSERALTILLASHLPEDVDAIRHAFHASGLDWKLLAAADCREAWTVLHREEVDVVVAEADLPDPFAWRDLLDEIDNMGGGQPVIIASRRADEILWAEVLNLGGFDLLSKPFDPEELTRVIAMAAREGRRWRRECDERRRRLQVLSGAVA